MTASVLFYVQHLLGIGHLARASLVARALADKGASVTLVTGGRPVPGFPGSGIDVVQLPPVSAGAGGFGDLVDERGQPVDDEFKKQRCSDLLQLFESLSPDILLIEAFPFGRGQMRFELVPLLDTAVAADKRPLIASSVRDILQTRTDKKLQRTVDDIRRWFDAVIVHGDDRFADLGETFPFADRITGKVHHTGIVSAEPGPPSEDIFDVVVSAGGGKVGEYLIRTAIAAKPLSSLKDARWCLIAGANLDDRIFADIQRLADDSTTVERHRTDFRALLAAAKVSVSQAGYNTVVDILRGRCRPVLVPFASGGETEQTIRADRLARRGWASVISEDQLDARKLAAAIDNRVTVAPADAAELLNLDGANHAAQTILRLHSAT